MTLAWFRADAPQPGNPFDDTAALIGELRSIHDIDVYTPATTGDFERRHARTPCDLTVFELDNTPAHARLWPHLLRHGGALMLRTLTLHDSRAAALMDEGRPDDYLREFTFDHGRPAGRFAGMPYAYRGRWPMLRAALMASRVTVVPHGSVAEDLRVQYPESCIRVAATGVTGARGAEGAQVQTSAPVTFGTLPGTRADVLRRVMDRAGQAGANAVLSPPATRQHVLRESDVILSVAWPWSGEPAIDALAAMAAGKPLVVLETAATADWPALDPQTWQPRGPTREAPIVVSIDPLDEEHSLVLAIARLSAEPALRRQLGLAGNQWWHAHATPAHAAADWTRILSEASELQPPSRPSDWPAHLGL